MRPRAWLVHRNTAVTTRNRPDEKRLTVSSHSLPVLTYYYRHIITEWRRQCFQSCLSVYSKGGSSRDHHLDLFKHVHLGPSKSLPALPGPGPPPKHLQICSLRRSCQQTTGWHSAEMPSCSIQLPPIIIKSRSSREIFTLCETIPPDTNTELKEYKPTLLVDSIQLFYTMV